MKVFLTTDTSPTWLIQILRSVRETVFVSHHTSITTIYYWYMRLNTIYLPYPRHYLSLFRHMNPQFHLEWQAWSWVNQLRQFLISRVTHSAFMTKPIWFSHRELGANCCSEWTHQGSHRWLQHGTISGDLHWGGGPEWIINGKSGKICLRGCETRGCVLRKSRMM